MMKVSIFFRYFFCILSILAVILGITYFALYYSSKQFRDCYKEWDDWIMNITFGVTILNEIANIIYAIVKDCKQPNRKFRIKNSAKISIPLLLLFSVCSFVLGGDAFYMQLALLFLNISFFIGGEIVDYTEVREVITVFEDFE